MVKWEYIRIMISWGRPPNAKGAAQAQWYGHIGGDDYLTGFENILNHFGKDGWEAISADPTNFKETRFQNINDVSYGVEAYTVVFKRPLPDN